MSHVHTLSEREIKACITEAIGEFSQFIALLHRRFASQLPHDLFSNVRRGLVRFDSLPKHAVRVAVVAAIGESDVANLAAEILEDSNQHDLAQSIRNRIETNGND